MRKRDLKLAFLTMLLGLLPLAHSGFYTRALRPALAEQPSGDIERLTLPDYRQWTHVKSMVIFDQKHPLYK